MKKRLLLVLVVLTGMFLLSASIVWAQAEPRFTDNGDETVTDNVTGLMWAKDRDNLFMRSTYHFHDAAILVGDLILGNEPCGGPAYTDWRLPTKKELQWIGTYPPATWDRGSPEVQWTEPGAPFVTPGHDVNYWSRTTYEEDYRYVYSVSMEHGYTWISDPVTRGCKVWPVRGGN
jgi:hypothetical protein